MVQLVDEQPRLGFIVFVFGEINERGKILDDITAVSRTGLTKTAVQNSLPSLRR